ncbi:MAG: IS701 family transposase [Anaerolineae bacterium]
MPNLPPIIIDLLNPFAPCFYGVTTWTKAQILLIGTILTPGKRTVTAALRVMGLKDEARFAQYHHVLSRAVWSPLDVARKLLRLLVTTFGTAGEPLIFGMDDSIERRWGHKIAARGIYRDPVRSSASHFVKTSGLRWISLMLLTHLSWAERVWALPFMTVLAPSERYYEERGRKPKKLTDRAQQMVRQLRRWLPQRPIVIVADSSYAALELLATCQALSITVVTRLRLDAALYDPAPPYAGMGRPRRKGQRLPTPQQFLEAPETTWTTVDLKWYDGQPRSMEIASHIAIWFHYGLPAVPIRWVLIRDPLGEYETVCLLGTDQTVAPNQIVEWFVMRWQLEVTFEEARRHLGVETQRQWSDKAIARTTPLLLGLFSWITLVAHTFHASGHPVAVRQSAWYTKTWPTFSDALALVRHQLWPSLPTFQTSGEIPDIIKVSRPFFAALVETLCYAA